MNTTVDALKNAYVELGGSLTDTYGAIAGGIPVSDYVVIPDVINAIAQIAGTTIELPAVSGSDDGDVLTVVDGKWAKADVPSELPAVSASDNGDVLTVVNGEWDKAQPSGGESPVQYLYDKTENSDTLESGRTSEVFGVNGKKGLVFTKLPGEVSRLYFLTDGDTQIGDDYAGVIAEGVLIPLPDDQYLGVVEIEWANDAPNGATFKYQIIDDNTDSVSLYEAVLSLYNFQ